MKKLSFPKEKRLVTNSQFKAVLARRLRVSDSLLILFIAENSCSWPRLGVSVGKSCGNAVMRNRIKRLLRQAFRQNQDQIPAGFDYLVMISPESVKLNDSADPREFVKQLTFNKVRDSFLALVKKAVKKIG